MSSRSVGSTVGVAICGAIANGVVASRTDGGGGDVDLEMLPVDVLDPALHAVFVGVALTSVALVVAGTGHATSRRAGRRRALTYR